MYKINKNRITADFRNRKSVLSFMDNLNRGNMNIDKQNNYKVC